MSTIWNSEQLKRVKHLANSGTLQQLKSNIIFFFILGMRLQRYSTNAKKYPVKSFCKPWTWSPSLNFQKKGRFYQNHIDLVMWLEGLIPFQSIFFPASSGWENKFRVSKISFICWIKVQVERTSSSFLGISLLFVEYLCNCSSKIKT